MFDVGLLELAVIALVAVVVLGPDRLPDLARQAEESELEILALGLLGTVAFIMQDHLLGAEVADRAAEMAADGVVGAAVLQQRDDLVVGRVASFARGDDDLGVLGGRRRAAVEHHDHGLAGLRGEGVELPHQPPGGGGAVAPPAVGARADHVGGVDDPPHRPTRSS